MREIEVKKWCDNHEGREPATVERVVQIDQSKPRLLDLCDRCDKDLRTWAELIAEAPVVDFPKRTYKARAKTSVDLSLECQECDHTSPSRAALGQHTRNIHGKGLKEYNW